MNCTETILVFKTRFANPLVKFVRARIYGQEGIRAVAPPSNFVEQEPAFLSSRPWERTREGASGQHASVHISAFAWLIKGGRQGESMHSDEQESRRC